MKRESPSIDLIADTSLTIFAGFSAVFWLNILAIPGTTEANLGTVLTLIFASSMFRKSDTKQEKLYRRGMALVVICSYMIAMLRLPRPWVAVAFVAFLAVFMLLSILADRQVIAKWHAPPGS